MKEVVFSILVILLVPFVYSQDWFNSEFVSLNVSVDSSLIITPGINPFVEYVRADVLFVPRNSDFVAVRKVSSFPKSVFSSEHARFEWNNPSGVLNFGYSAVVDVVNDVPRVRSKLPVSSKGFENFVNPSLIIDSSPAIVGQANLLALGDDDLFSVVSKIGFWVKNNIEYNLSAADISRPASWVFENRVGTCDELTSLFISMVRSLKIPARFVSGVAFSNSTGWSAHGWAEVYFSGVGWVPFDPTFGQFGWIDPGHVKLRESIDPLEPSTVIEWRARDVDVKVSDLHLSASLLNYSGKVPSELSFSVHPLRKRVGFNGYNGIVVEIENLADYYVASEFVLSRVSEMSFDDSAKQIVLPPHGRGRLFWIVKVNDLDPYFDYTLPLVVSNGRASAKSSFSSGRWDIVFSKSDVDSAVSALSLEPDPFSLSCFLDDDVIRSDVGRVDCILKNNLAFELPVVVCSGSCKQIDLVDSASVSFDVPAVFGVNEVVVSASSDDFSTKSIMSLIRLDSPKILISDFSVSDISDSELVASFVLDRVSFSYPRNVSVSLKGGGVSSFVELGDLLVDQSVSVSIDSSKLYSSDFFVSISYSDDFGKHFSESKFFSIDIKLPWYKRLFGWFSSLF